MVISKNLKEDTKGSMYIKDVAEIEVKSTEEALELMHKAHKRRVMVTLTSIQSHLEVTAFLQLE